ncbi:metal ABC transporter substrate-binding protein [Rhodocyclus tenuis]|uniref:Zinc/manganese transport system substrate-binding protein n=1 Tax=Rhodocyclus tenuis TaxID=1066 RepID=A0A840G4Q5_RHOTE|nr:zinc ABC transporter substrate-binding protein [Rhodocyclus tenuis]MBB4245990.1 zinc/manganese transport system substrate-binding protein [Rhodocyclus tenuis]
MKRIIPLFLFALFAALALPAQAALKVFASVPEWAALAKEIGGERVDVYAATSGLQDPHRIDAKPSLIARARSADLVVATGAELEIGWLPLVLRESGNARVQPGQPGYFEATRYVVMREAPAVLDRAEGDVHAAGNPHIQTDPRNLLKVGEALTQRLAEIDPANATAYQSGWQSFAARLRTAIARWEKEAAPLAGVPVLVQHKAFPYLTAWLRMKELGSLETRPGVEPSSAQLAAVVARQASNPARMVLRPAYQYDTPSRWVAAQTHIVPVLLPFTVGGTPEAKDLFSLYDDTVRRLLQGLKE